MPSDAGEAGTCDAADNHLYDRDEPGWRRKLRQTSDMDDRAQDQWHDHDTTDHLERTSDNVAQGGAPQQDQPVECGKHLRFMNGSRLSTAFQIKEEPNSEWHQKDHCNDPGGMNEHELTDIAPVLSSQQRQLTQTSRGRGEVGRGLVEAAEAGEERTASQGMRTRNESSGRMASHQSTMERATSAVKALPAMTPMMGRAALRAALGSFQSSPATAIMAAAVSDPSIHGSGKSSPLKMAPPIQPEPNSRAP